LRQMDKIYLERQGFVVLEAQDASVALQISHSYPGPIHLLLTDVIMPGMNGRVLAERIAALRPETRILYMSGYTENAIGHNGVLDAGIILLQKPFTLPALKAKVREVLDTPLPQEVIMPTRYATQTEVKRSRVKLTSPFRAQRFNLHLPLKYRMLGEDGWHSGTTENISRSGLLFQAEDPIPATAQLEINLVLPAEIAGLAAAEVVCRGEIVRTVDAESSTLHPSMAAKILQYHFQHGSQLAEA
ncbi:MAG TPA: response regulator, partial [Terriglobales bacterium]|nr:response regulator [Terriglobales bacterium]